ncbi:hypothetical protein ACOJQI_16000 [Bacillus salacetis]|uniref:hypothetical protein n=1 Tax=Bacillus salacetis TaxID=2315464 RepID=UPI003B9E8E26
MKANETIIQSKANIDDKTYEILSNYIGNGQVTSLNKKAVTLENVEVMNKFNYSLNIQDTYDNSNVEFIFKVYKLNGKLFLLYIKHDIKFRFEVKETIEEVRDRHTWFIQIVIDFHQSVLIPKRN